MNGFELICSIEWYVNVKNLSLKKALSIRCPMDIDMQQEHRMFYSEYLAAVMSIIELLLDKKTPQNEKFRRELYNELNTDNFTGENYYNYLRELRNSVVHRGGHLTSSARVINDFPLVIAPTPIENRNGNYSYDAPEKYLIDIIIRLEKMFPSLIFNHIVQCGWDNCEIDSNSEMEECRRAIIKTENMPDWVKELVLPEIEKIDFLAIRKEQVNKAMQTIKQNHDVRY